MGHRKNIFNLLLLFSSFLIGITIIEFFGRYLGLGDVILYDSDPLVGYRLRPNQSTKRRKNSFVNSDYEGFRFNPDIKISENSKYIVFVGDSVTYGGSYIDDSELFSSKFCSLSFENYVCLNNGVNAWGTMNMGRFIANYDLYSEREILKIILVILPGDERRNLRSFTDTPFWSSNPRNPKAINEVMRYITLENLVPLFQRDNELVFEKKEKIYTAQRKQSWKELNSFIDKSNYKVDIVITPPKDWFLEKEKNSEKVIYENLLNDLDSPNINKKCNLYNFIKSEFNPELYVDGVHLSKKGHELWSKKLDICLKD